MCFTHCSDKLFVDVLLKLRIHFLVLISRNKKNKNIQEKNVPIMYKEFQALDTFR